MYGPPATATVLFVSCSFIIKFCHCLDKPCYRLFTISYQKSYRFEWDVVKKGILREGGGRGATCMTLKDRVDGRADDVVVIFFFWVCDFPLFLF